MICSDILEEEISLNRKISPIKEFNGSSISHKAKGSLCSPEASSLPRKSHFRKPRGDRKAKTIDL
jgi:hypothetical protein